jgi:hypothetical protein
MAVCSGESPSGGFGMLVKAAKRPSNKAAAISVSPVAGRLRASYLKESINPDALQGFARDFVSLKANVLEDVVRLIQQCQEFPTILKPTQELGWREHEGIVDQSAALAVRNIHTCHFHLHPHNPA